MTTAIKVENLVKNYGANTVLKGISFSVEKGTVFGLLGTNGAGKTTTLEIIEGVRRRTSGDVETSGITGVQLQSSGLEDELRVQEALRLYAMWNNNSSYRTVADSLGLSKLAKKKYKELSTGQKGRLHLAIALIRNPDIVILDEPTAGLDIEGRHAIHREIRQLKSDGKTIILSSHDMAEVEELCDTVAILKDGNIIFLGTTDELKSMAGGVRKIYIMGKAPASSGLRCCVYEGIRDGYAVFVSEDINTALIEITEYYISCGAKIIDVKVERQSLEESYLRITE